MVTLSRHGSSTGEQSVRADDRLYRNNIQEKLIARAARSFGLRFALGLLRYVD